MAGLKPIVGEIKAQVLNDNFSYINQKAEEAGVDPELEQKVEDLEIDLNVHKAETTSYVGEFTRDASITGVQEIRNLPSTPKSLTVMAIVSNTPKYSIAFVAENNQRCIGMIPDTRRYLVNTGIIIYEGVTNNATRGAITIVENGFNVTWSHEGSGATGTIRIVYLANFHGE